MLFLFLFLLLLRYCYCRILLAITITSWWLHINYTHVYETEYFPARRVSLVEDKSIVGRGWGRFGMGFGMRGGEGGVMGVGSHEVGLLMYGKEPFQNMQFWFLHFRNCSMFPFRRMVPTVRPRAGSKQPADVHNAVRLPTKRHTLRAYLIDRSIVCPTSQRRRENQQNVKKKKHRYTRVRTNSINRSISYFLFRRRYRT